MTQEPDWDKLDTNDGQGEAQTVDPHGEPESSEQEGPEAL
jgi:hypothetical protein